MKPTIKRTAKGYLVTFKNAPSFNSTRATINAARKYAAAVVARLSRQ